MDEDEWVKTATINDSLVVDLLMQLKKSPPTRTGKASILRLDWKGRQRRTKPVTLRLVEDNIKRGEPARASPTTPLSWSRATSPSAEATADADKSKAVATSRTTPTKRLKRKTLAELKEEESVLLKERMHLKKEVATLNATMAKERANNEKLKRRKLDLHLQMEGERIDASVSSSQAITGQEPGEVGADEHLSAWGPPREASFKLEQEAASLKTSFLLPDLNLPLEETGEFLHGMA